MKANLSRREFIRTTGLVTLAAAALPSALAQDKTVTMAFVGVAHIHTPGFINLLKGRNDVRVKSVWDHDAARAGKRAKELNARVVSDVREIWSDPEITAVVICSETNRHHDLVLAAAKAGKHMFVEKPLGITAKESIAMATTVRVLTGGSWITGNVYAGLMSVVGCERFEMIMRFLPSSFPAKLPGCTMENLFLPNSPT